MQSFRKYPPPPTPLPSHPVSLKNVAKNMPHTRIALSTAAAAAPSAAAKAPRLPPAAPDTPHMEASVQPAGSV